VKVKQVETRHCGAGWRNYHFVKITAEDGTVGWSEYDEGFGSPGVTTVVEALEGRVVGESVFEHEKIYQILFGATRPAQGSVIAQGLGAIENALLDVKAKLLGVPCYDLLGGRVRDQIRVYWSHCATWRISSAKYYPPAITNFDGVKAMGEEVREKGFSALKTNIFTMEGDRLRSWAPGFNFPFEPALNVEKKVLDNLHQHLEAFREGGGADMDILLDLNFNAKPEGYLKILRSLSDVDLFWVEIDSPSPEGLAYVRDHSPHPISSCETLLGLPSFIPYFEKNAMDVAIVDAVWNGVFQSMKIAAMADGFQVNVAPHNFYGHLSTMMNAHFAAAVPNLRIMETDIDRLAWDDEVFTRAPDIRDGHLFLDDTPGWGTEPDEAALTRYPPRPGPGFLANRKGSNE